MVSCAVISRIQLIEAPYLNEFIYWYVNLGFDRVYFINTESNNIDAITQLISPDFNDRTCFLNIDKQLQNEPAQYLLELIRDNIKEEYVLNVDSDELLYIDAHRFAGIKDFLNYYGEKFYIFNWINVPSFDMFAGSMVDNIKFDQCGMYANRTRKSLGTVKAIFGIDWHVMNAGKRSLTLDFSKDNCFVFHSVVRSVSHQLLKQKHQTMGNFKDKNHRLLGHFLSRPAGEVCLRDYPFRMLTVPILKHIVARHDIRSSLKSITSTIQTVPKDYRPDENAVRRNVALFLKQLSLQGDYCDVGEFRNYLEVELGLLEKLDIRRIPAELIQYTKNEEMRITVNRIYDLIETGKI